MSCDGLPDAFFKARLAGTIDADLHWQAADMQCDGMRRPDGQGLRVTFTGAVAGERLTLLFGAPRLAEGASGRAVPVNVTLIRQGGRLYGTRGEGKCVLDEVAQALIGGQVAPAAHPADPDRAAQALHAEEASPPVPRRWRIDARGFCLEPARAVAAGSGAGDAILLTTFDFRGQLAWEPDPPAAPAVIDLAVP